MDNKLVNWILGILAAAIAFVAMWLIVRSLRKDSRQRNKKQIIADNPKSPNVPTSGTQGVFFGQTRGLRNNNPGNIEKLTNDTWEGQVGTDGRFAVFKDLEYGTRAIIRVLKTYNNTHGINTINDIINRFAPEFVKNEKGEMVRENDPEKYIAFVVEKTGISRNKKLDYNAQDDYVRLAKAMCHFETGSDLPLNIFTTGFSLA